MLKVTNEAEEPQGLERFETFLDCGSLELTETSTALSLESEGKHKLQDYPRTESLTATIAQGGSFLYLRQWDLGDLVTVIDRNMGVAYDTRISSVKKAKYRVAPVGGDYYPWQYDDETGSGQDGYAGSFGKGIGKLQIVIE